MLEIVNHSHIVQNNSFLILTLTYTTYTTIQLLKQKYQSKPFISYLNIKLMLSDKFVKYFLQKHFGLMKPNLIRVFQILNSKLMDKCFPLIGKTKIITDGEKWFCVRESLITKRLGILETNFSEAVCLELTVSKKWLLLFAFRSPQKNDKYMF